MMKTPAPPNAAGAATRVARLQAFRESIEAEADTIAAAIEILRREQSALVGPETGELAELGRQKQAALDAVGGARETRRRQMGEVGLPRDPIAAEMRLAAHKEVHAAWTRLRRLTREASVLTTLNARVAAQKLQYVSARLDALRRAAGAGRTYDATGRRDEGGTGRVIAAA